MDRYDAPYARQATRIDDIHGRFDPWLIGAALGLVALGVVMVGSSSIAIGEELSVGPFHFLIRHVVFLLGGAVLCLLVARTELKTIERFDRLLLLGCFVLLLVVFIPGLGHTVNGARRWINLGVSNFQTVEAVKLMFIVWLSSYLVRFRDEVNATWAAMLKPIGVTLALMALLALQPDETITQVLSIKDYDEAQYLALATKSGLVKKTRLAEYDSNRTGGVIAINLREMSDGKPDELVSARLVDAEDHLLLISRKGMSIRFAADDETIRPTGRATSGVTGMRFRDDDRLLTMDTVTPGTYVFVVTEAGFAKRTPIEEYRLQGRGGMGIKVAKVTDQRGDLVGGLIVSDGEEVLVVMERGKVVRSSIDGVPAKGRNTMGVVFAKPGTKDRIIAVTRGPEEAVEEEAENAPLTDAEAEAAVAEIPDPAPQEPAADTEGEEQQ